MRVFIGADHRGFKLKEDIKTWLGEHDFEYEDVGARQLDPNDDYPVYAEVVARKVSEEKSSLGILFCGSGVGVDIVANKIDGVRAGLGMNKDQVESGRRDDDINVLAIAADYTDFEQAKHLIQTFLETEFDEQERRKRRLDEIKKIEHNN